MIEIYPNIFVGNDKDALDLFALGDEFDKNWYALHAAKERWHRQFVGYSGRGAPKYHPEYLAARLDKRMALNIVDAKSPEFFSKEMITAGLDFLEEGYKAGKKLLINCNQGESRGPSLAMLFVFKRILKNNATFEEAEAEMKKVYPAYNPGEGIRGHLMQFWGEY